MTNNQVSTMISENQAKSINTCMFGKMSLSTAKAAAKRKKNRADLSSMVKLVKGVASEPAVEEPEKPMDLNFGSRPIPGIVQPVDEQPAVILPAYQAEEAEKVAIEVMDDDQTEKKFDNLMFGSSKPNIDEDSNIAPETPEIPAEPAAPVEAPKAKTASAPAEKTAKKETAKPVKAAKPAPKKVTKVAKVAKTADNVSEAENNAPEPTAAKKTVKTAKKIVKKD